MITRPIFNGASAFIYQNEIGKSKFVIASSVEQASAMTGKPRRLLTLQKLKSTNRIIGSFVVHDGWSKIGRNIDNIAKEIRGEK